MNTDHLSREQLLEELAALHQERALLTALLGSMPEQIYFKNRAGHFIRVNTKHAQMLGLTHPEEAIGKTDYNFYVAAIADAARAEEDHMYATGTPLVDKDEQQTLVTQSGETDIRWFSTTKAPMYDQAGECIGTVGITRDITERKRTEVVLRESAMREELLRAQSLMLEELSTPLIPISANAIVMPLIGAIDSARAQRLLETMLHGVGQHHASIALLDITGVPLVDTQVANALLSAAQAVQLLGAQVVLTGIRPEVAQTLVGLGVDLTAIVTRATLQDGIAYAMQRR